MIIQHDCRHPQAIQPVAVSEMLADQRPSFRSSDELADFVGWLASLSARNRAEAKVETGP